jgi:hypothetical protein
MNDLLNEIRTFHRHTASVESATLHSPWSTYRPANPTDLEAAPRGGTCPSFTAPATREESVALVRDAYGFHYRNRPVPSAGGIYGLDLVICNSDEALHNATAEGQETEHRLGDGQLARALGSNVGGPFTSIVIAAHLEDYVACYGTKGYRFALLEAGHVGQRLLETAAATGLRTASIGSFDEERLLTALGKPTESVLHVLAVGR